MKYELKMMIYGESSRNLVIESSLDGISMHVSDGVEHLVGPYKVENSDFAKMIEFFHVPEFDLAVADARREHNPSHIVLTLNNGREVSLAGERIEKVRKAIGPEPLLKQVFEDVKAEFEPVWAEREKWGKSFRALIEAAEATGYLVDNSPEARRLRLLDELKKIPAVAAMPADDFYALQGLIGKISEIK